MGVSIKLDGASFANPLGTITLPDRTLLTHEFMFGVDFARTRVNLVTGAPELNQIGTPTYNAGSVLISAGGPNHGFDGIFQPGPACSMVQIRKTPTTGANGANVFFATAGNYGLLSYNAHPGPDFFNNQGATAPIVAAFGSHPATTDYYMHGGAGGPGTFGKVYVGFGGSVTSVTATGAGGGPSTGSVMKIGAYNPFNAGSHEVAYAAMWNRILTDAEFTAVYNSLKAFFNDFVGSIKVG